MGMATTPDRDNIERDLKFPLLIVDGVTQVRTDGPAPGVDSRLINAQTMRLIAEVQRLRMAASRPDTSGEPVPGMVRPEDTSTTAEQRWGVLCAYRRYRLQGNDSLGALDRLRDVWVGSRTSAMRSALTTTNPSAHAAHSRAAEEFTGELVYIDKVLRPRVERWNYVRPGMLG